MKLKIIAVPPGFAPLHIREAWVGVEIPIDEELVNAELKLVGTWSGGENRDGYDVMTEDAVKALESAQKGEASNFWKQILHKYGSTLRFKKSVCELIDDEHCITLPASSFERVD